MAGSGEREVASGGVFGFWLHRACRGRTKIPPRLARRLFRLLTRHVAPRQARNPSGLPGVEVGFSLHHDRIQVTARQVVHDHD